MESETEDEVGEASWPKREGLEGQHRISAFTLTQMRCHQRG